MNRQRSGTSVGPTNGTTEQNFVREELRSKRSQPSLLPVTREAEMPALLHALGNIKVPDQVETTDEGGKDTVRRRRVRPEAEVAALPQVFSRGEALEKPEWKEEGGWSGTIRRH